MDSPFHLLIHWLVLIVGCGHQTLSKLLHWVEQVFDEPLYGIIGGLHYPVTDGNTKMEYAPKIVGLSPHDSCPVSLDAFSMLFFGMNLIGPSMIMFCSMLYFVNAFQREHERSETLVLTLTEEREKLAEMSAILKKMFGRYLSTEVMNSLIENLSALELGDEKRSVTLMMTELRGFTALSERLDPEQVVQMLNVYFEAMSAPPKGASTRWWGAA
jgi:hypothetical protein